MENGDTLEKLYKKVIAIEVKLDSYLDRTSDQEKRIRFLEKAIWVAIGIVALVQTAIQFISKK